ncbi:MAG: hydantoinase/oxoprolinase family protein [Acidimicrobiia bacterium]|nr:MAG: hydantoinase/oxoprolinase family protein [Acidimicrobiia bacterium]
MILGADVGGTFTDVVVVDNGSISTAKVPTSSVQSEAIAEGLHRLTRGAPVDAFVNGTTVATNALLERAGARTLLVTDAGFEDVIEIGRQDRPSLYDPFSDRPAALVARVDRIGLDSEPIGVDDGSAHLDSVNFDDIEAIAVAMIDGHIDDARESAIARSLGGRAPGVPISLSSVVSPEFREFERISTTVLNAYLSPVAAEYLKTLDDAFLATGLARSVAVMRSSGGLMSIGNAATLPAAILLSGPAGGVVAAQSYARDMDLDQIVSFDMGGTSTDVCSIEDGAIEVSYERRIDGYVCRMPSVGIHTVGAGGGSIAWIDPGGALRVGPRSSGANPGPACYGRGGLAPTVTDANVVLRRIDPESRLGGDLRIDDDAAHRAVTSIGDELGLSVRDAALGIVSIAEEVMAGAIRSVSVERGADPGGASLMAFGGAGGLHAIALARTLGMSSVVIPPHGGVFSALGLLLAPPRVDLARAVLVSDGRLGRLVEAARDLEDEGLTILSQAGSDATRTSFTIDIRYLGQSHEIGVPWDPEEPFEAAVERFSMLHRQRNGFARSEDPVEVVAVRCTVVGEPVITMDLLGLWDRSGAVPPKTRAIVGGRGPVKASIYDRDSLSIGDVVEGPAVIEEREATTFLDTGDRLVVHRNGSLEITW